ncbi:MAG TPA: RecX family transcriptional regulator [Candidatus Dormibacteraeota bacterium]|jgi:regulatory protein|nr:RecX family transcriptional regulator [Candidatus Dormibacteraeota bacterium]
MTGGGEPEAAPGGTPAVNAYEKGLRILNAAGQTRLGLARRLSRAGYGETEVEEACAQLEAHGYLDDRGFAASRLRRRQQQGRGARLIAAELRQKGVSPDVIDDVLADRDEEAEVERAMELAVRMVARRASEPPAKRRDHVMAALVRRGYPASVARRALEAANRGRERE